MTEAKNLGAPLDQVVEVARSGRLPVPQFAAGGIATPADAALCMALGAEAVFVGSGVFLSESLVAPLMTAWSGYHFLLVLDDDAVVAGRDVLPADPVVLELVDDVFTGSSTNFSLSMETAMSCSPMPRNPPTPMTTAATLPFLSRISSLMSPSLPRRLTMKSRSRRPWR